MERYLDTIRKIAAGSACGAMTSIVWAISDNASTFTRSLMFASLLLVPFGGILGLFLSLNCAQARATSFRDRWFAPSSQSLSIRVLVYSTFGIAGFKCLFEAGCRFGKAFHHQGLAALAFVLFLCGFSTAFVLIPPFVERILGKMTERSRLLSRLFARPIFILCFVVGIAVGIAVPPLLVGPGASGPFGFVGILRTDGGRYVLAISQLILTTGIATFLLGRRPFGRPDVS